jgi:predicted amidophosphoribosyltransferase
MVPPPMARLDYARVVKLVSGLSRKTGIPSAQFAVKSVLPGGEVDRSAPRRPDRTFVFSSPETGGVFTGKVVLVIDDIYRSGRSLHAFCDFLTMEGKVKTIEVLVGTIVEK